MPGEETRFKAGIKKSAKHGGKREGAGAKPDWFKSRCKEIASSPKYFDWAQRCLDGEKVAVGVNKEGDEIIAEADPDQKGRLWEKMAAYGFGKPVSVLEVPKDGVGLPGVVIIPVKAEE